MKKKTVAHRKCEFGKYTEARTNKMLRHFGASDCSSGVAKYAICSQANHRTARDTEQHLLLE